jgi:hypothetical protein
VLPGRVLRKNGKIMPSPSPTTPDAGPPKGDFRTPPPQPAGATDYFELARPIPERVRGSGFPDEHPGEQTKRKAANPHCRHARGGSPAVRTWGTERELCRPRKQVRIVQP